MIIVHLPVPRQPKRTSFHQSQLTDVERGGPGKRLDRWTRCCGHLYRIKRDVGVHQANLIQ